MLAKDIATTLNEGTWKEISASTLYPHSTTRIRVVVEEYKPCNGGIFIPEDEDADASDSDFLQTFMNTIGRQLCAAQEALLIKALVNNLKNDSKASDRNKQYFDNFLKSLAD